MKVASLLPSSPAQTLLLKVVETKVAVERTRADGSKLRIAEVIAGDETACILMTLRNGELAHSH
jgi:hypothetical protein